MLLLMKFLKWVVKYVLFLKVLLIKEIENIIYKIVIEYLLNLKIKNEEEGNKFNGRPYETNYGFIIWTVI